MLAMAAGVMGRYLSDSSVGTTVDVLGRTRATLISSTSLTPCLIGLGNL